MLQSIVGEMPLIVGGQETMETPGEGSSEPLRTRGHMDAPERFVLAPRRGRGT